MSGPLTPVVDARLRHGPHFNAKRLNTDLSQAPDAVQALVATLESKGFTLAAQRGDGAVNRLVEIRRGPIGVRVTADRGQWWVELGAAPLIDWFDPDVWDELPPAQRTRWLW